jgi:hypothetical protein
MELVNKWKIYEQEKEKLVKENLTAEEYTRRIVELCNRLEL